MITPDAVITAMAQRGLTLAAAESLTGGLVANAFVGVPGASLVFRGGVICYATATKASVLSVDEALLNEHGPVHPEVALQMARGVRRVMSVAGNMVDIGVATTGVAGPGPADGHPAGTVYIAVACDQTEVVVPLRLDGNRAHIRQQSTDRAVAAVAKVLAGLA